MLLIFGRVSRWLRLIAVPEQRSTVSGRDFWPGIHVYWKYMVGIQIDLVYLG